MEGKEKREEDENEAKTRSLELAEGGEVRVGGAKQRDGGERGRGGGVR